MAKTINQFRWLAATLMLVATMVMPSTAWAQGTITPTKPSGEGTAASPYMIGTAAELYWFAGLVNGNASVCDYDKTNNPSGTRQNTAACAKLTADIVVNSGLDGKTMLESLQYDESGDVTNGTEFRSWKPIGNSSYRYTGTFDGNGKTISGLYFNDGDVWYVGLFGYVQNSTIQNVGVVDSYFKGNRYVGGVCGYVLNGTIQNVGVVDSYFKGGYYVGGVCGYNYAESTSTVNYQAAITNCYNTGSVSGSSYVGGVCGYNYAYTYGSAATATITNCHNTGEVSGVSVSGSYVGGVCGYNFAYSASNGTATATLENCYNTGSVSGNSYGVGGVCGENFANSVSSTSTSTATITNCHSTGTVSGSSEVGGVCGWNNISSTSGGIVTATITNCYYDCEKYTGKAVGKDIGTVGDNVAGKTTAEFKSGAVAWLLNGSTAEGTLLWYQNIDNNETPDAYPVLDSTHGTVYKGTVCERRKYSNTENPGHEYKNGICTLCGAYQPATENASGVYEISNAGQLYWFAAQVNSGNTTINAKLTANIVVNSGLVEGKTMLESLQYDGSGNVTNGSNFIEWTPIGSSYFYTGTFDGNGKTISGLYFNDGDAWYVGLFGFNRGTIQNVGVVDSYFYGYKYVGGVCGYNEAFSESGTATATITNCYNTGSVSGSGYVGGVCGYNEARPESGTATATITNCYNTGSVSGSDYYVGGVCGYNEAFSESGTAEATITNCYNIGSVSGSNYVGGVCGCNNADGRTPTATITNCYYDSEKYTGGAVGGGKGTVENVAGKTTDEFKSGAVAWLLNGSTAEGTLLWYQNIDNNETPDAYPVLDSTHGTVYKGTVCEERKYSNTENPGHEYKNGICTFCDGYEPATLDARGVYEISNAGQLYWFAGLVNGDASVCDYDAGTNPSGTKQNTAACAVLTANIVVNSGLVEGKTMLESLQYDGSGNVTNGTEFRSWTPIGNSFKPYTGTFDGNGKTISGLYFNNTSTNYVGLFGANGGTIKNVGVVDSHFKGGYYVGGVCGYNEAFSESGTAEATITNCYNTGSVSGSGDSVGGVCGYNYASTNRGGTVIATITNCYNTGSVSGNSDVGGVCGYNYASTNDGTSTATITNCHNTGSVSGSGDSVGGVCGYNNAISMSGTLTATITNCYNIGSVSGSYKVGGVCGENTANSKGGTLTATITNCYNIGSVSGSDYYVGGVCGYNNAFSEGGTPTATITNCYNIGSVSGSDYYVGGVCGYNSAFSDGGTPTATITNCYYDSEKYTGGAVGGGYGTVENVAGKTTDEFKSGEVCYLLQSGQTADENGTIPEVWGQQIGTDGYPVLGSDYKVIKAAQDGLEGTTYWATFSNLDSNVELMAEAVYNATVSGGKLTLTKRSDNRVAAGEGVLLKANSEYVNAKNISDDVSAAAEANNLVATPKTAQTIDAGNGFRLYRLTYNDTYTKTSLGFYLGKVMDENGNVTSDDGSQLEVVPGEAYLKVSDTELSNVLIEAFPLSSSSGGATEIECIGVTNEASQRNANNDVYDLQGRKVNNPSKGLYIVNGKTKIIKK